MADWAWVEVDETSIAISGPYATAETLRDIVACVERTLDNENVRGRVFSWTYDKADDAIVGMIAYGDGLPEDLDLEGAIEDGLSELDVHTMYGY